MSKCNNYNNLINKKLIKNLNYSQLIFWNSQMEYLEY